MYVPKNMEMKEFEAINAFISEFGFGTLVSPDLQATRLPLLFEKSTEGNGRIIGHMARANPQWKNLTGSRVTVLFNGPHSYISPTWYVSQPAVPTWNYAQVQCFGVFNELDEDDARSAVNALVKKYEPELLNDQKLMPAEYTDRLLKAIIGFSIQVDDIHAKEKLGQHKTSDDQISVFNALADSQSHSSVQLADYMQRRGVGNGS